MENPTAQPTADPTTPTANPTSNPSATPTANPTSNPTATPTALPTDSPTPEPTQAPIPTENPTAQPTADPTTPFPTSSPTKTPTPKPTWPIENGEPFYGNEALSVPTTAPTVVASSSISAKEIFVIGMGSVCVLTLGLLFWKYGCCCCGCCFAAVARKSRKSEHGTQVVFGLCEASRQLAGNKAWISQSRMSVGPTTPGGVSYPLPLPAKLPNCESGEFLDDDVP